MTARIPFTFSRHRSVKLQISLPNFSRAHGCLPVSPAYIALTSPPDVRQDQWGPIDILSRRRTKMGTLWIIEGDLVLRNKIAAIGDKFRHIEASAMFDCRRFERGLADGRRIFWTALPELGWSTVHGLERLLASCGCISQVLVFLSDMTSTSHLVRRALEVRDGVSLLPVASLFEEIANLTGGDGPPA